MQIIESSGPAFCRQCGEAVCHRSDCSVLAFRVEQLGWTAIDAEVLYEETADADALDIAADIAANPNIHWDKRSPDNERSSCTHRPRKADREAGYTCCMFCEETGENCDGKGGYCRTHGVVWDVWQDRAANADR